ncbi:MAG: helix-turn-helix domain-containing protein [Candidatus Pacebacteria bacterium]|nr:helix-turn-helix domain-containing protein [Candidatus Paceibacterota bacterium]
MPHVSTKKLDTQVSKQIATQLVQVLTKRGSKILTEVLTETEHLMLAKRLAIILMLNESFSYYRIGQVLGVSTSTIKRLHAQLLQGDFQSLERLSASKKEREMLWKTLESILRAGMLPQGKGRWQNIDALLTRKK